MTTENNPKASLCESCATNAVWDKVTTLEDGVETLEAVLIDAGFKPEPNLRVQFAEKPGQFRVDFFVQSRQESSPSTAPEAARSEKVAARQLDERSNELLNPEEQKKIPNESASEVASAEDRNRQSLPPGKFTSVESTQRSLIQNPLQNTLGKQSRAPESGAREIKKANASAAVGKRGKEAGKDGSSALKKSAPQQGTKNLPTSNDQSKIKG